MLQDGDIDIEAEWECEIDGSGIIAHYSAPRIYRKRSGAAVERLSHVPHTGWLSKGQRSHDVGQMGKKVSDFVLCFRVVRIPRAAGSTSPNAVAFTSYLTSALRCRAWRPRLGLHCPVCTACPPSMTLDVTGLLKFKGRLCYY